MSRTWSKKTVEEGTVSQAQAAEPHRTSEAPRMPAEELLAIPPRADDLSEQLAARPARARLPRLTLALGSAVLVAAGFVGGVLAQKQAGASSGGPGSNRAASFASAFARAGAGAGGGGRTGFGGGTGAGGFGGGAISGTVTVVSGDTLFVTAADGSVYTVKTSGSTTVSIAASGTVSQLKPGQRVTIAGSADSSGNVTATSITAATN